MQVLLCDDDIALISEAFDADHIPARLPVARDDIETLDYLRGQT